MPSLRTIGALIATWYAFMLNYRAELFLWMVSAGLPLIMMGVWIEAGASGMFPDVTAASVARYFLAVFVVRQLTSVWVIFEFEHQVLSGKLSAKLLHPMDPVFVFLSEHVTGQLARLPLLLAVLGIGLLLFPSALADPADPDRWLLPGPLDLAAFALAVAAAFGLRFLISYSLGLLAFRIERVSAFAPLSYLPYLYLSGLLFPLEALDPGTREALLWLPFPWMVWFPAQLLGGGDVPLARGFATLAGWLLGLFAMNRWLWRSGLKRYSAMGA